VGETPKNRETLFSGAAIAIIPPASIPGESLMENRNPSSGTCHLSRRNPDRLGTARFMAETALEPLEPRKMLSAVKIMPLGDSITESFPGHATYRFYLYKDLVTAGYDVDFVGSMTGANGGSPLYSNFDQNHEGHSGYRTDQILSNVVNWANLNKPDVVLLHTGSNDIEQGQSNSSTASEIGSVIDALRSVVPSVKILLAQIIPEASNTQAFAQLNSLIANVAAQKNTSSSPVVLVDQYTGFDANADTFDGVHPDESGERKMADRWFAALRNVLPAPTPPNVKYLSDLSAASSSNGWGPIERDHSNGEMGANDGGTLAINGLGYIKGLGAHAGSDTTYNLSGGSYTEFDADIGVDDEVGGAGSVVFQVYVDGALKYASPTLTGSMGKTSIAVPLAAGASTLRLVVTTAGDDGAYDHADWADARLLIGTAVLAPAAPSGLTASYDTANTRINLHWTDNASDETGFRIERKVGAGGTYSQIAEIPQVNLQTYIDSTPLTAGTTYYYRVSAYKSGATSGYSNEANATVPSGSSGAAYVSDLPFAVNANGWGPVERDRSNGETGATDGHTITLNGVTYSKGLGTHGYSEVVVPLNGQYTQFQSDLGVDDEVGGNGSVNFQVFLDNSTTPVYDSGPMTGSSATQQVTLDVTGATSMKLVVTNAGDGAAYDHADWANARLLSGTQPPPPPPASNSYLSDLPFTVNANGWGPPEKDRSNGETGANDGHTLTLNGKTYAKGLGVHAASDLSFNLNGQYNYFFSDVGIDDEVSSGSAVFQVWADGVKIYDSGTLNANSPIKSMVVSVAGVKQLRLVVTDAGDGNAYDHADWAGAAVSV
jgi:lysophospholipase L1-like esterase